MKNYLSKIKKFKIKIYISNFRKKSPFNPIISSIILVFLLSLYFTIPTFYNYENFDKEIHEQYLTHIDVNNLKGLKVEMIYSWKVGETMIMDRSHIHCSSSRIKIKKLGLTTFTKK